MSLVQPTYPASAGERDTWIVARRGARAAVDPTIPYAFLVEEERFDRGEIGAVATVFLTNRECPFRCAMCDLWMHTLAETVPAGAIAGQISYAFSRLDARQFEAARQVKLYNSGSFFDARAIPVEEYAAIAGQVKRFERVIVESHPAFVGERCWRFAEMIGSTSGARLEVAMGLETAHPATLERLNKRMTLEQYARAAEELGEHRIALRTFVLVQPPFLPVDEALEWVCRSIDFAFGCGATAVSLLPTRGGNGAMEELARMEEFVTPSLGTVESALDYGVGLGKGRVFVDLWEMERVAACAVCREARVERMRRMNLEQVVLERVRCGSCA